jgi:tRNA uridine 5-carboxymethylaminomethyl modification enzyme
MIDDLTLQGVTEPYRMLTARAEYRLRLRADNADVRLTPQAIAAGCVSPDRRRRFEDSRAERAKIEERLQRKFTGAELNAAAIPVQNDGVHRPLTDWLRFPEVDGAALLQVEPALAEYPTARLEGAVQDHRYAPYVQRQQAEIVRLKADEAVRIPTDLDYAQIAGLSNEMVERLSIARPSSLGAASRLRGITPAALAAILVHARRKAA